MKILWSVKDYVPDFNAGDTHTHHAINKYLVSKGHEVRVMLGMLGRRYEIDGVMVGPRDTQLIGWADAVFTSLDFTQVTNRMVAGSKPLFHYVHNSFEYPTVRQHPDTFVFYNAEWVAYVLKYPNESFILPPPIDVAHYSVQRENAEFITLINPHKGKGSDEFYELAEKMPSRKFLAVRGAYGQQDIREMPNVTHWPNQKDIREAYKVTRLLLMPSKYESYGRTASEAICSGIPVLCYETPGLLENLKDAGIYCKNISTFIEAIMKLDSKKEYDKASDASKKRAKDLNPIPKLEEAERWIKKKVGQHNAKREQKP